LDSAVEKDFEMTLLLLTKIFQGNSISWYKGKEHASLYYDLENKKVLVNLKKLKEKIFSDIKSHLASIGERTHEEYARLHSEILVLKHLVLTKKQVKELKRLYSALLELVEDGEKDALAMIFFESAIAIYVH